jgi:hypothetical protein
MARANQPDARQSTSFGDHILGNVGRQVGGNDVDVVGSELCSGAQQLVAVAAYQGHRPALLDEHGGDRQSDACRAAGHECGRGTHASERRSSSTRAAI